MFDARMMVLQEGEEWRIVSYMESRQRSRHRNAVGEFARQRYTTPELHGKKTHERIEMMPIRGVDWDAVPNVVKFGCFIKKGSGVAGGELRWDAKCFLVNGALSHKGMHFIEEAHWAPKTKKSECGDALVAVFTTRGRWGHTPLSELVEFEDLV